MAYKWIESKLDIIRYREERHIKNENDPIYYIIRRKPLWEGFFSNYFYVLSHIIYGDAHGWKSVVDMQNYPTLYSEKNGYEGVMNCWECYFRQPDNTGIREAYSSNNYVLSKNQYYGNLGVPVYSTNQGHITEDMVRKLYVLQEQRIPILNMFIEECDIYFETLFNSEQVIGVHVRGTDMYKGLKLHTIPPRINDVFDHVDSILSANNCSIFLCSDENRAVEWFTERYGDRVKTLHAFRANTKTLVGIHKQIDERNNHHYLLGKEVLLDALMLSKCDYLICGVSNVTSAAVLFNNRRYRKEVVIK